MSCQVEALQLLHKLLNTPPTYIFSHLTSFFYGNLISSSYIETRKYANVATQEMYQMTSKELELEKKGNKKRVCAFTNRRSWALHNNVSPVQLCSKNGRYWEKVSQHLCQILASNSQWFGCWIRLAVLSVGGHILWCPCSSHDLIGLISPEMEPFGSETALMMPELLGWDGTAGPRMAVGEGGDALALDVHDALFQKDSMLLVLIMWCWLAFL